MPLPTRIGRLRPPVLCFVVSRATVKDGDTEEAVRQAVAGGVNLVQLREPDAGAGELLELTRKLKVATRGRALLIVNDRIDVANAAEVDGVQIPEDGLPTRAARGLVGRYNVIGRSVHDLDAARAAIDEGSDFALVGTIYKSTSHPDVKPAGIKLIEEITKDSSFPVLAIGGITADKVEEVVKAGAAGVAVISAIAGAADMKAAAEELSKALKDAWEARLNAGAATAGA
jgi:thiamine-phosphate pyrophosphorylase